MICALVVDFILLLVEGVPRWKGSPFLRKKMIGKENQTVSGAL